MRATSLGIQKLQVDWKFPSTIFTNLVKTILICTCIINSSEQCKTQSELISEIRANSTTNVFPVKDPSSTVDVEASIDFLHILNVNIVEQNIAVRIWAVMRWYNELVSWDVNEFCGVNDILDNGATDLLWFPDIILPQLASNQVLFKSNSAQMRIAANGKTFICRYATLDFTCNMNSIKFPYDLHECEIGMKADADTTNKLIISHRDVKTREFMEGDVWDIISYEPDLSKTVYHGSEGEEYSVIQYKLTFQRKGNFIFTIICLPGVIINILCVSTFFLPCSSGEKIGFTVTLFLAQSVNLMIFSDFLPHGGNSIPLTAQYLIISILMTSFSVLYGVWSIRCKNVTEHDEDANTDHVETPQNSKSKSDSNLSAVDPAVPYEPEKFINMKQFLKQARRKSLFLHPKEVSDASMISNEPRNDNDGLAAHSDQASLCTKNCLHNHGEIVGFLFGLVIFVSTAIYSFLLFN